MDKDCAAVPAPTVQPLGSDRRLRTGLLNNPLSGRNRRGLNAVHRLLAEHPWVRHYPVRNPAEVAAALEELAPQEPEVLVINGGDGTVQAVLTALLQRRPFARLPLLAIVAGGTTNMTAGDVGLRGTRVRALRKLLAWAADPHRPPAILERPVLRVQAAPDRDPVFGMFFGAGAIIKGIEFFHQRIDRLGVRHEWAPGLALIRVLAALARRDSRYIAPVSIAVNLPGQPAQTQDYLLLLISSLERLLLGLRPYWGAGSGVLRYTAVRTDPQRALRTLPSLFWGRPNRLGTPENGYFSHNVDELRLTMDSAFTLDGELYETDSRAGPLTVSRSGPVSFIRL